MRGTDRSRSHTQCIRPMPCCEGAIEKSSAEAGQVRMNRANDSTGGPAQECTGVLGEAYLKADPPSAAHARTHIVKWIGADHPAYENVRLAASELVTNAVVHARPAGPYDLILLVLARAGDLLRVEVTDPGGVPWDPYVPRAVPDDQERGRGLTIVAELSRGRWGVRDHGARGRTVWCALDARPARDEAADPAPREKTGTTPDSGVRRAPDEREAPACG
ncbi:ATP-binding protein [Streptosporangium sp. NPDC048047]|uniref:ATP-binding protein n=1 Tax=Streptosporangium sp. NPDC048047 TaxID=3155748 RepID=UPI003425A587